MSSETVSIANGIKLCGGSCDLFKVGDSLKALSEHKVALEQAEKIEQVCNNQHVWSHDQVSCVGIRIIDDWTSEI